MSRIRTLAVFAAGFLSACFSYVPTELQTIPEGGQVRVYVGREALAELVELGELEAPFVTGTLMRRDPDTFLLRVPVGTRQRGFLAERFGQDVFIRNDQVVQLERREINRVGTGVVALGSTVAAAGLVFLIIDGARSGDRTPVPGDVEARVPIFVIPWR